MKIAIITTGLLPVPATKGGAVENLVDFFLEANEITHDVDVDVYSCYDKEAEVLARKNYPRASFHFIHTNSCLYRISNWLIIKMNKIFRIGRLFGLVVGKDIRKKYYDAILVENYPFHCPAIKHFTKAPVILHTHNRYVEMRHPLLKQYLKSIDGVICVSDFIANDAIKVKEHYGLRFPVSVAYNGIKVEDFYQEFSKERKRETRKSLGIYDGQKVILYTGRFIPAKGVKELLMAFLMLPNVNDYVLLVIGSSAFAGSANSQYIEEVKKIAEPIKKNVKFTGYVNYEDIPVYYCISDIQVVPSVWEEPACLVSLEGMAAGLPIVCSDSGGTPEHISDDCAIIVRRGDGYVERMAEAINKLLSDDELRKKMGKAGRKRSEMFSTSCFYDNMVCSLNEILGNAKD